MKARLTVLMAAVAAVMTIAAGCGDDGDSGGGGQAASGGTVGESQDEGSSQGSDGGSSANDALETSSLSKEQFVKRANALCRREKASYSPEINAFLERAKPGPEDVVALRGIKAVLYPITEAQIMGIRQLGAPAGDEEEIAAALEAQEEGLADLEEVDRLKPGELPTDPFEDATAMLEGYGLKGCIFFP